VRKPCQIAICSPWSPSIAIVEVVSLPGREVQGNHETLTGLS